MAIALVLAVCLGLVAVLSGPSAPPAGAPAVHLSLAPSGPVGDGPQPSDPAGPTFHQSLPPPAATPPSTPRPPAIQPSVPGPPAVVPLPPMPSDSPAVPPSVGGPPVVLPLPPVPSDPPPVQSAARTTPLDPYPLRAPDGTAPVSVMPSALPAKDELPAWRRHAVAAPDSAGRPMIAVVIDDMGVDQRRSAEMAKLPGPLTLAYLPYGRDLARQTAAARGQGHELLVHVSMQPLDATIKTGPNVLTTDLSEAEIRRRLAWALDAFDGYVGINNHMGSRFTADRAGMAVVMEELKARGLLFLDSRTGQNSVGISAAAAHGVPHAGRHVFLDNELSVETVQRRLAETERLARQNGFAVAIGHPHDVTIAALAGWLPELAEKGFVQAPISAIVARLEARRGAGETSAARDSEPRTRPAPAQP